MERKIVKVYKNDQVRKFDLEIETFDYLKTTIENIFEISNIILQYKDEDGDMITISTDLELSTSFKEQNPLKIFLKSENLPIKEEKKDLNELILHKLQQLDHEQTNQENSNMLYPDFFEKEMIERLNNNPKIEKEDKTEKKKFFSSKYREKVHTKK